MSSTFQVGNERGERVTAIKVLGIPLPAFLEGRCLSHTGFGNGLIHERRLLWLQCLAVVGRFDIGQHHFQREGVANDMVDVEKEIVMVFVLEQTNMKQTVIIYVEWYNHPLFLCFDVSHGFYFQYKRPTAVKCLDGVALLIQCYTREESGMC